MSPTKLTPGMNIKIRQTHARMFRACEMKFNLAVNHGLFRLDKSPALSIGTICHAGRAKFLETFDEKQAIQAMWESIHAEIAAFPSISERPPTFNKNGSHSGFCKCPTCMLSICVATMVGYFKEFSRKFQPPDFQVKAVEQQFEFEICQYQDVTMTWTGTVDADILLRGLGLRLNDEFKTTSETDIEGYINHEEMSLQHVVYPYHLQKIKEIEYHGTFLDVVKKATKTLPSSWGYRIISKTEKQYLEFERQAFELLKRLVYHIDNDYWPKNTDACKSRYGLCEFWQLCFSDFARYEMAKFGVVDSPLTVKVESENQEEEEV